MRIPKPAYILLLCCLLGMVPPCMAKPAFRGIVSLSQPDGSTIRARLHGDEWMNWTTDLGGHSIVKGEDGFYCFAYFDDEGIPRSSGWRADDRSIPGMILQESLSIPIDKLRQRAREERALVDELRLATRLSDKATREGESEGPLSKHAIVVLAEFPDKPMTFSRENFVNLLTQRGYSYNGATGSALDYFEDMFRGDYTFSFSVSDVVTLDHESAYYFGHSDDGNKNDKNPARCIADACIKAHEQGVDFSTFDDDGDGYVDCVIVFVAGLDEAEGGGDDCVWSHQWWVKSGGRINCVLDGVTIDRYAVTTEFGIDGMNSDGSRHYGFNSIGTFCHEFSHTFGLPDFYDTDGEASGGTANGLYYITDLMDGGCYNNFSRTPPHYSAVDYYLLGLGEVEDLKVGDYNLEPISVNRRYIRLESGTPGEYYLFEAKGTSGWNSPIGGGGLAIYHIDQTNTEAWRDNTVNVDPSHEGARLLSANPGISPFDEEGGITANLGRMIFFPYGQNNSFSALTDPPFVFWNGEESQFALTNIRRSADNVLFRVASSSGVVLPTVASLESSIYQDTAIIRWESSNGELSPTAMITVSESGMEPDTLYLEAYSQARYALRLESLKPRTAYKVEIRFTKDGFPGTKADASFTTKTLYDSYPFIFMRDSERSEGGEIRSGATLPLIVYNAQNVDHISWFKDGKEIFPEADGVYHMWTSGVYRAVITYNNGEVETIQKVINLR